MVGDVKKWKKVGRLCVLRAAGRKAGWLLVCGMCASSTARIPEEMPLTAAGKPFEGRLGPFLGAPLFEKAMLFGDGTENVRGAHMVVTVQGAILITGGRGGRRRSEDGGRTWGPIESFPRPEIVDDYSGQVLALSVRGLHGLLRRSHDDGKTWGEPERVAIAPNAFMRELHEKGVMHAQDARRGGRTYRFYMCSGETGITLRHGQRKGRLLLPVGFRPDPDSRVHPSDREGDSVSFSAAIYSDDGGASWQTSDFFPEGYTCSESALAELSDGRILFNARSHAGFHDRLHARELLPEESLRRIAWSYDGGETWTDLEIGRLLPDGGGYSRGYGLRAGLVRLPVAGRDILLYSNTDTAGGVREKMTVWASFDGGNTWPVKRLVYAGPCAYSTLAAGRPATDSEGWIYLLFEGSETHRYHGIQFARFNLAWVLRGEATGDGRIPDWIK